MLFFLNLAFVIIIGGLSYAIFINNDKYLGKLLLVVLGIVIGISVIISISNIIAS